MYVVGRSLPEVGGSLQPLLAGPGEHAPPPLRATDILARGYIFGCSLPGVFPPDVCLPHFDFLLWLLSPVWPSVRARTKSRYHKSSRQDLRDVFCEYLLWKSSSLPVVHVVRLTAMYFSAVPRMRDVSAFFIQLCRRAFCGKRILPHP